MIFGWLASLFTGPIISAALGSAVDAYKSKLAIENTRDAKAVELAVKEIEGEIAARHEATRVLIAEQGHWSTRWIRPMFALPLVFYWWKILLYDKMLGWGTTDPLVGAIGEWATWMVAAYFVTRPFEKMAMRIFRK